MPSDQKIAVYTFEVWDREKARTVVSPRMATADAIRRVKGMADLESVRLVAETELDAKGFYPHQPQPLNPLATT